MPDLGKYAVEVLSSYAVSILLLAALTWLSARRAKQIKKQLENIEKKAQIYHG